MTFAHFNEDGWVVDSKGVAILQVVDMNDRIVSTQAMSGNSDFHVMAERTSEGLHTTCGLLAADLGLLWVKGVIKRNSLPD